MLLVDIFLTLCSFAELTKKIGQPEGLVVVHNGDTQRVESHKAEHCPVESVCLHHAANGNPQETLFTSKIGCWTSLCTPNAGSGHGHALQEGQWVDAEKSCGLAALTQHGANNSDKSILNPCEVQVEWSLTSS